MILSILNFLKYFILNKSNSQKIYLFSVHYQYIILIQHSNIHEKEAYQYYLIKIS